MEENLRSMGDTGKSDFKEEVIVEGKVTETEEKKEEINTEDVKEEKKEESNAEEKTVNDVIKEKQAEVILTEEQKIARQRELDIIKKAEEFLGYKQSNEEKETIVDDEKKPEEKVGISDEEKEIIEQAKKASEAAKRIVKVYEEKFTMLMSENKELKTNELEKNIEIKSLKSKIEEMANERANKSNTFIETDDVRLRFLASIRKRRSENPEDESLKEKEITYLSDELSILVPHLKPEELRSYITKKDEDIDIMSGGKSDYIKQADEIAKKNTDEIKKQSILNAIKSKKINYDKY